MIQTIKNYFWRRKTRSILSKYVSQKAAKDLLDGKIKTPQIGQFDKKNLGVVLALVKFSSEIGKNMETISNLAFEYNASYETMTNGLMIFCFGRFPNEQNIEEHRQAFVKTLGASLGEAVKIVHGNGTGLVGLAGNKSLAIYTFIMPKFADAISTLVSLKDGEIKEFTFS